VLLIIFLGYHFYHFQLRRRIEASEARYLREMDTFKTNFYTNITHEFRTPLTVIQGMAEQIQASPEKYLNTGIPMIQRNSSRLLQLVNQVLELSRLESGKLQVQRQRGDVGAFIQYIFESFTSFAGTKGISLSLEKDTDIPIMDFDPEKIQTVLGNLLSNAIKFTPTGGRITGSVQIFPTEKAPGGIGRMTGIDAREYLAVCVQDTGKGISQEELGRIFERYYQAEGSPSAGSGVGLTLARELARLMGGDVTASSTPGEGSVFTLWLPVLQLSADLPPVQVQSAGRPIFYDDAAAWPVEPKTVKTRPTLLLVEDSPDVLYYLSVSLSPWYNLLSARNGKEGLKKALETVPDLVISDIMMPEMDGLEFCAQLKNDVHISHIPVILLTARAGLPDKIEGLDRGADAYLVKPFDRGELLAQVRQLLEQRKRLQVYYRQTAVGDTGNQHEEHDIPKPGVDEQFLVQLRETVAARLSDPNFSATDLERALGMSHAQLFRKMKALLGYSANTLIRKMRIRKAQELLGKQEMSIAEVAYAVGFKEPAYFSKVFKDETGVAPGEWGERKR
jgi:DNA-binding response OmpR family regulator/nitrogen-specific signal transduction histidine kinase